MAGVLIRAALRRSLTQVRHVTPVRPGRARGLTARTYRQVERDFGMLAPPVALHSPAPEVMAAVWLMLRESLVAGGAVDRATKEVVATEVSAGNSCPYCVEVHGATLRGLGQEDTDGVVGAWAAASATRAAAARCEISFPAGHTAELVAVAVTFQYLNRMVNVFLGDSPLPPNVPAAARGKARGFLGWFMGSAAGTPRPAGASLDLLPDAPLPAGLSWAAANPNLAGAFARAVAAIEAAGRRSVPEPVRRLVSARLATWDGAPPGLGRGWVDAATEGLTGGDRVAARLALLTALASYQVDDALVGEFLSTHPGDATLIELTSWASLAAARRVGGWIPAASNTRHAKYA